MDLNQAIAALAALGAPTAAVIIALGRHRETRDKQYDEIEREKSDLQRSYDELRREHRDLGRRHDALLGWTWEARKAMREQGVDPPELPWELR